MIGLSSQILNGPHRCFNAAQSWLLGWYRDKHETLDIEQIKDTYYYLNGVSSYEYDINDPSTIMKITNCVDGFEYYIMYYYDSGITSGGKNSSVDISRKSTESLYADSYRLIELSKDGLFKINARKDGKKTKIVYWTDYGEIAKIRIKTSIECKSKEDCDDYNSCTDSKCSDCN